MASIPFIRGMERSVRIRSGFIFSTHRMASRPSSASPTTSKSGLEESRDRNPSLRILWSSAITIRYFGAITTPSPSPVPRDSVAIGGNATLVILNALLFVTLGEAKGHNLRLRINSVKNLIESKGWKSEILRLMSQNDIKIQSPAVPKGM
jgi:hypothetical protein